MLHCDSYYLKLKYILVISGVQMMFFRCAANISKQHILPGDNVAAVKFPSGFTVQRSRCDRS